MPLDSLDYRSTKLTTGKMWLGNANNRPAEIDVPGGATKEFFAPATHRLNYASDYGAIGEDAVAHSESLIDQDTAETLGVLYEQDISGVLSALAAGDHVGIRTSGDAVNTPFDGILGVRFKYS